MRLRAYHRMVGIGEKFPRGRLRVQTVQKVPVFWRNDFRGTRRRRRIGGLYIPILHNNILSEYTRTQRVIYKYRVVCIPTIPVAFYAAASYIQRPGTPTWSTHIRDRYGGHILEPVSVGARARLRARIRMQVSGISLDVDRSGILYG